MGTTEARGDVIGCIQCLTYLTSPVEVTSNAFTGRTGPATLYKRVWNVSHGELMKAEMTTGLHVCRDIHCISCDEKLGWMYELAPDPSQAYKEGQMVLENDLVSIMKGAWGEDARNLPPNPVPRRQEPSTSSIHSNQSYSESSSSSSSADLEKLRQQLKNTHF